MEVLEEERDGERVRVLGRGRFVGLVGNWDLEKGVAAEVVAVVMTWRASESGGAGGIVGNLATCLRGKRDLLCGQIWGAGVGG